MGRERGGDLLGFCQGLVGFSGGFSATGLDWWGCV